MYVVTKISAENLSHAAVCELLDYSPLTGRLIWKAKTGSGRAINIWNAKTAGREAGCVMEVVGQPGAFYRQIRLFGTLYLAHRLIFFMVTGAWPKDRIDHEDRNGLNNAWTNLREATANQNQHNRTIRKDNPGRFKGVRRRRGRWEARITFNRRGIYLGIFETDHQAAHAYDEAARLYHGEFANTNAMAAARG